MTIVIASYVPRRTQGLWHMPWLSTDRPWPIYVDGLLMVHDIPWHDNGITMAMPCYVTWLLN